ncbi:MAG TPA: redoxin domain-containing protein [Candidatus Solibacter sp.]|nr:redoxin domain-containing protein [Candidatus Solibacter sp.]
MLFLAAPASFGQKAELPPVLKIGAKAPDFTLSNPVDGKTYSLKDFDSAKVLVVVFTCNHCPTAEIYEGRIKKIAADYRERGVALVAIQPNGLVGLSERSHDDMGDSPEEMKIRAEYRDFNFPYLYDGDTQAVARKYGPIATPHVYVFDHQRILRYTGHVDNNPREKLATVSEARDAIDAVLAGKPVAVETTAVIGCVTKWKRPGEDAVEKAGYSSAAFRKKPVTLEMAGADTLAALRKNGTGKFLVVNFWATWCEPCRAEFPDLLDIAEMYQKRPLQVVTVSTNYPDEKAAAQAFLEEQHAVTRNLIFGSTDPYQLIGAFDKAWSGGVPFTMVLGLNGEVLYKSLGSMDALEVRRTLLRNFPDDQYVGMQEYFRQAQAEAEARKKK